MSFPYLPDYRLPLSLIARHIEEVRQLPAGAVNIATLEGWAAGSEHVVRVLPVVPTAPAELAVYLSDAATLARKQARVSAEAVMQTALAKFDVNPSAPNPGIAAALVWSLIWVDFTLPDGPWSVVAD